MQRLLHERANEPILLRGSLRVSLAPVDEQIERVRHYLAS